MRVPLIRSSSVAIKDFCLYGGSNLWDVIRHMLVVRESSKTRRNAFEVYKVFAFASPHICVLCVVGDTSLPQTSCSGCVVCVCERLRLLVCVRARASPPTHTFAFHTCRKNFLPSIRAAVTVFCRQAKTRRCCVVGVGWCRGWGEGWGCVVGLCDTDKI